MKRFLLLMSLAVSMSLAAATLPAQPVVNRTVVMLHGLGLRSWAMARLGHALERGGYHVINLSYPSRTIPLEQLATTWLPNELAKDGLSNFDDVDFVTHSMGGIVVRLLQRDHAGKGRVVMIAPPNQGSELVDHLNGLAPFRWFTGVNGRRLGTRTGSLPRELGPWPEQSGELGVIAGDRSLNPLFSAWIKGPNDGKVAVSSTRLEGMSDFIVLHHSHTWLQWRADTARQVLAFLRDGEFEHVGPGA